MNHSYEDIRSRISEPPIWWDERAVPRYVKFSPSELANIYAREAALVLIACQNCGCKFQVAISRSTMDELWARRAERPYLTLAGSIHDGSIHYGDPPNIGCCPAGPTMNCDDLRVLEYWKKGDDFEWRRDTSAEISLPDAA